jgi:hypothetical protein
VRRLKLDALDRWTASLASVLHIRDDLRLSFVASFGETKRSLQPVEIRRQRF